MKKNVSVHLLLLFGILLAIPFSFKADVDISILTEINQNRNQNLDYFFQQFTNSATPVSVSIPLLIFIASLFVKDSEYSKQLRLYSLKILSAFLIATILSTSFKNIVQRPRPFLVHSHITKLTDGGGGSFPSGHSIDAFAFALSVSLCFRKWYVVFPSFVWAIAIAYSRMFLGVHFPSDVLGGLVLGFYAALLSYQYIKLKTTDN